MEFPPRYVWGSLLLVPFGLGVGCDSDGNDSGDSGGSPPEAGGAAGRSSIEEAITEACNASADHFTDIGVGCPEGETCYCGGDGCIPAGLSIPECADSFVAWNECMSGVPADEFFPPLCVYTDQCVDIGISYGVCASGIQGGALDDDQAARVRESCSERDQHFEDLGKSCGKEGRCAEVGAAAPECVDQYIALNDCLVELDAEGADNCALSAPCETEQGAWYACATEPEVEVPDWVYEPGPGQRVELVGVNLAGADFGEDTLPGEYGVEYTYPTFEEVDYFVSKGMNVFRIPFRWERLQRSLSDEFDSVELGRLTDIVSYATDAGASVILDPHNYARYDGQLIGSDAVPDSAFADFWSRLASEFSDDELVIFGLVNEPHDLGDGGTERWLESVNTTIAAIRDVGAENLILVPGNGWTAAETWTDDYYGTPNSEVMGDVEDPADNLVLEVHQYLDPQASGTSGACPSETIGVERVTEVTEWAREGGFRLFLGEFGAGANPTCLRALDDMILYLGDNDDVWLGFTWWAAGPWWGDYFLSIEPRGDADRPQMDLLERHLTTP